MSIETITVTQSYSYSYSIVAINKLYDKDLNIGDPGYVPLTEVLHQDLSLSDAIQTKENMAVDPDKIFIIEVSYV